MSGQLACSDDTRPLPDGWVWRDVRCWSRQDAHFRWDLMWSLWRQWTLIAYRTESAWKGMAFYAEYAPDGSLHMRDSYDEAQGMRWAAQLVTLMTPMLELEARPQ